MHRCSTDMSYCRTGFDSDSLTATKIATKIDRCGWNLNTHYSLYRSCLPIYGIAIVRSLSFLFLDHFKGNANISVAIKSGSTVIGNLSL